MTPAVIPRSEEDRPPRGSTGRDGATRRTIMVMIVPAMGLGLIVRVWAITTLGRSFRTTVEVDAGQPVVQRGPYRWIRHPSYTGVLLLAAGYGLAMGNWLSLLIAVAVPVAAMLRRIGVEEAALTETLGRPYELYRTHTKRLVPGLW